MRPPFASRALLALSCLVALPAPAQVRHCTTPAGIDVYTDRRCEELGAAPAPARPVQPANDSAYRGGCARTLRDLAFALQSAIEGHDANRLADSYLWAGLSTRDGYAVMERLAAIAQRPLAGIVPVYPAGDEAQLYPQETVRQAPVALRLQQTLRNGATPADTVLPLRRYLGCWWISF
ncbi:MAG TPA: hypothetical protein VLM17_01960 [Xanthomonadaceae bacterium]|nr:hypothetical protein [Xanthomonadaceae bacterium]